MAGQESKIKLYMKKAGADFRISAFFDIEETGYMTGTLDEENKVMTILHTVTYQAYQGQGIAKAMLEEAVRYALDNKYKIHPVCSYAKAKLPSLPDGQDLII
jgi:predicted GNAT family acetyltransferase